MNTLVRDRMGRGLITCAMGASLGDVAALLTENRVHAVVVVDGAGKAVGLLSDFDLLAGEWLSADPESLAAMRKMTAGELMSSPLNTIDSGEPIAAAAAHMRRLGVHRLVVTEAGEPAGVISMSDLVAHLAAQEPVGRATVGDVMSHVMLVCRPETPALDLARGLTDSRFRSVLVLDDDGRLLGLISGWDLLACVDGDLCAGKTAVDLMHPVFKIRRQASLHEAASEMVKHHRHRLVVVDSEDEQVPPVGVISSIDIVNEMARPGSVWRS
ncbi:MAG TPA: CBS domain-containing protein [Anaerolineales bacterium]|nr:CBS domain-containing protein [Anaerolineales bacterium]